MASGHLRVLSLFPLGLFDSMCGNSECDVATLSVTCLIFLLHLFSIIGRFKVPYICRPEANPCVVDASVRAFLLAALNYFYHKIKGKEDSLR